MFEYTAWWHAMRGAGTPAPDVVAHVYDTDFQAIKYDRGTRAPFLNRAMEARRLAADDPLVSRHPEFYALGAFVVSSVSDPNRKHDRAKSLFVVDVKAKSYEELHDDGTVSSKTVHVADHFSFLVSRPESDKSGRRLKMHRTMYVPISEHSGRRGAMNNPLPTEFELGDSWNEFRSRWLSEGMHRHARVLHDMLRRPDVSDAVARNRGRRRTPRAIRAFADVFKSLPLRCLFVIAVPNHGSGHDVTVFCESRLRSVAGLTLPAYHVRTGPGVAFDQQRLQEAIAGAMAGATWDDFVAPPE